MKKLLDLNTEALLTGRSRGKYMPGGIWDFAPGLNPFLENDTYRGMLAITATPTDKTGAVILDIPIAYTKDELGSTYNLYIIGLDGHFYRITSGEVVSDLRSGTPIDSPANGMGLFRPASASNATMLFARQTRIGTWDLSGTYPTGWSDAAYNPGTTTPHRPFHRLFDRLFFGNKNYVGEFYDDGTSTVAMNAQSLDIDPQETITALSDDGRYLVIAAARTVQESYNGFNSVRILFWNAGASATSWDWETSIPNETAIRGMWREGNVIYAVGKRGVYTVSFGQAALLVYPFDSDETIAFDALNYGHGQSIAGWGDGVIFGKLATAFSKFLPGTQRIAYNPLQGFAGDIGLIIPDFIENKVYVGTRQPKLYSFDMTAAGSDPNSNGVFTRFLDLGGLYHVQRLDMVCPNGPGGTMTIKVEGPETGNLASGLVVNETKYSGQQYISIPLQKNITTTRVRITIAMSAGTPSFSALSLWGEPAT